MADQRPQRANEQPAGLPEPRAPRLPVYLDGDLLEALAQTLDPSGVPGTRRVQTQQTGRTLEGRGYAVRADGRIGSRLLGGSVGAQKKSDLQDEASDAQTEEQEFIVREATLLWQAHNLLAEEGTSRSSTPRPLAKSKPETGSSSALSRPDVRSWPSLDLPRDFSIFSRHRKINDWIAFVRANRSCEARNRCLPERSSATFPSSKHDRRS